MISYEIRNPYIYKPWIRDEMKILENEIEIEEEGIPTIELEEHPEDEEERDWKEFMFPSIETHPRGY